MRLDFLRSLTKSRFVCLCLILLSLTLAVPALADDSQEESKENASEEEEIEVVVTASRGQEQDPLEIPQAIQSISKDRLKESFPTDLDNAVREIPGIGLAPAGGNPNYWQEGFTIRGLGAQRVLTLTDGVRQAGQGIGYGGGNLSLYDTFGVERIEVLKGPASVLYGTDAFGGVINIITREPYRRDEFGVGGSLRYGFDGTRDLHRGGAYFDFGDEDYAGVFGGSYTDAGDVNLPDDLQADASSFENYGYWGKLDYYFSDRTKVRLIGNFNRNNDVQITDTSIPLPIAIFPPPGETELVFSPLYFEFPRYGRNMAGAEFLTEDLDGMWDMFKTGFYWQEIYREFHRQSPYLSAGQPGFAGPPLFVDPNATVTSSVVDTDDTVNTYEWQTQARLHTGAHALTVGTDVGFDVAGQNETEEQTVLAIAGVGHVSPMVTSREDRTRVDARQLRTGLYLQDSIDFDPFTITPGVRADVYSVDDDTSGFSDDEFGASGSLGNVYRMTPEDSLYLTLATGFRAPDLGERFQNGIVNFGVPSQIIGKADLDPERSWSAETGIKHRSDLFQVEAATYVNQVDDYIGLRNLGNVNGFETDQYDNLGRVAFFGGEIGGTVRPIDEFEFYANAARTWSDSTTKVDVPNWFFQYGPRVIFAINEGILHSVKTALNFRTVLESEDNTPSGGRDRYDASGFTVANLELVIDLVDTGVGDFSVIGGIKNLFNEKYQEPFFANYQPGRSLYAGVQVSF